MSRSIFFKPVNADSQKVYAGPNGKPYVVAEHAQADVDDRNVRLAKVGLDSAGSYVVGEGYTK